jgi:hypothetical protein
MGSTIEESGTRDLFRRKLKIEHKARVAELPNWQLATDTGNYSP